MTAARPHDLLRLTHWEPDLPDWVADSLTATPWVVVRRSLSHDGDIPVGVRGHTRSQRYAMTVPISAVEAVVTPEALGLVTGPTRSLPALEALQTLAPLLRKAGVRWGPTGSVGFELATGTATATPDSDLDLAVYQPADLGALQKLLRQVSARVDCQIEFGWGAASLADLMSGTPQVLVKCPDGPRLVDTAELVS